MNMYVDSFDDDELEIVLDESEGLEVLLNSGAITWSEIAGDITKNKAVVDFLNSLPMLPDIPVEEVEHILKANVGEATWQIDNKATQEELLNSLSEVNQLIADGLATKQDVGDYALRSELEEASQTLQDNIDTKQDAGDYATKEELNTTSQTLLESINTKQDVGDYVTNTELENKNYLTSYTETDPVYLTDKPNLALKSELPDLTDYVKNTDYATEAKAGVIKNGTSYCFSVNANTGVPFASSKGLTGYTEGSGNMFVGKTTLENIKDDYVKRGVTANTIELTADEKASAKQWLGYAEPIDIIQAIASIPQFSLSIVEALPETGEKMTLYLVSKGTESPDVYDEYIWIEETSTFEFLGTTAVDLTDYVKNTDYAGTDGSAGLIKTSSSYGTQMVATGFIRAGADTLESYKTRGINFFIGKGTLENIKNNYVKEAITVNDIELTDDEKTSARTWLGAIGNTDYAQGGVAGVVKASGTFACGVTNGYIQTTYIPTLERYNNLSQYAFIGKGTLETALTQYSKTVLMTEDDYNALETKDANTLYLIEE